MVFLPSGEWGGYIYIKENGKGVPGGFWAGVLFPSGGVCVWEEDILSRVPPSLFSMDSVDISTCVVESCVYLSTGVY